MLLNMNTITDFYYQPVDNRYWNCFWILTLSNIWILLVFVLLVVLPILLFVTFLCIRIYKLYKYRLTDEELKAKCEELIEKNRQKEFEFINSLIDNGLAKNLQSNASLDNIKRVLSLFLHQKQEFPIDKKELSQLLGIQELSMNKKESLKFSELQMSLKNSIINDLIDLRYYIENMNHEQLSILYEKWFKNTFLHIYMEMNFLDTLLNGNIFLKKDVIKYFCNSVDNTSSSIKYIKEYNLKIYATNVYQLYFILIGTIVYFYYIPGWGSGLAQSDIINLSENDSKEFSKIFSPHIYSYKYDFEMDFINCYNTMNPKLLILLLYISYFVLKAAYLVYKYPLSMSIFYVLLYDLLLILSVVIYVSIYAYDAMDSFVNISDDVLKEDLKLNMYMRRTYDDECNDIINGKDNHNSRRTRLLLLILLVIYILTCMLDIYHLSGYILDNNDWKSLMIVKNIIVNVLENRSFSEVEIGKAWEKFVNTNGTDVLHVIYKVLYVFIGILPVLFIFGFSIIPSALDYVDNFTYLMKTYENVVSVIYNKDDLPFIGKLNNVKKMELFIDKFMYINVPHEIMKTFEDVLFIREFDAILCSGNINGAHDYVLNNSCNDELRSFLLNALNDDKNILFNNIGMSFTPNCNSFYLHKLNKYISLKSPKGRKVLLSGPSGSGKSTITNALFADSRVFSSFINERPAYLIDAASRKILPYYSEKYIPLFDKFNIMDNFVLADSNVQNNELSYVFDKLDISKYYNSLRNIFAMVSFSHGQSSRMLLSRLFISLNGIIKQSMKSITDEKVINEINKVFVTDGENVDFELIREHLKLKSFMVILDEPLSVLDKISAAKVMECVNKYTELGFTFIIIDHSGMVKDYADDIIKVNNKTCEYYTKINGEFINIEDLNEDFTALDNGYAFSTSYEKPSPVAKLISDYHNGNIKKISILNTKELNKSIKKLDESMEKLNDAFIDSAEDAIVPNINSEIENIDKIDRIVMLNEDNLDKIDKIDRIVMLNEDQNSNNIELVPILINS
jgi:ABC-type multidrug transport system fused ATPase/permease subunit